MNLDQLVDAVGFTRTGPGVPEWTLGCFRRRSISYFTGQVDTTTQVVWLQSRGLTFDLRLDPTRRDQVEGGLAVSRWDDGQMSWSDWTSFQPDARWPEPGRLTRVGDCLIEFAPSGAYVEDWRAQSRGAVLLAGLRLEQERVLGTGEVRAGGGLIVCGGLAGLVRGPGGEVSHATRDDATGRFTIRLSTHAEREGQPLDVDGFEVDRQDRTRVVQRMEDRGEVLERRFIIDTLERIDLPRGTLPHPDGAAWFERQRSTLLADEDR
jgi:hypothetical protein